MALTSYNLNHCFCIPAVKVCMIDVGMIQVFGTSKIDDIMYSLDADKRFSKEKSITGGYYYVEIWKYKNIDIVVERASSVIKNQNIGFREDDLIYELIFHPAGTVTKGWYYKKGIVMGYGKYTNNAVYAE